MGELADRIRKLADRSDRYSSDDMASELRKVAAAAVEFEQNCATAIDEAASVMATFTDAMTGTEDVSRRAMLLDYVPASRLADAEQRAAAAWAALVSMTELNGTIALAYSPVGNEPLGRNRLFVADDRNDRLRVEVENYGDRERRLSVFIVETSNAPANPDLLERASVELAEAYQRAKAEEQRQAEEKAAVAT